MPFYTAKGDDGSTDLLGKGRVSKAHARMEALGVLDEASAALGLARASCTAPQSATILIEAQRDLYKLMAEVAATPEDSEAFQEIDAGRIAWLEAKVEELESHLDMPRKFILPGDSPGEAAMAVARTVVRRAERRVVALFESGEITNPDLQRYLNRLSSVCFALELLENQFTGSKTTLAED